MRRLSLFVHTPISSNVDGHLRLLEQQGLYRVHKLKFDSELFPLLMDSKPSVFLVSTENRASTSAMYDFLKEFRDYRVEHGGVSRDPRMRIVLVTEGEVPKLNWAPLGVYELMVGPMAADAFTFKLKRHYEKAITAEPVEAVTETAQPDLVFTARATHTKTPEAKRVFVNNSEYTEEQTFKNEAKDPRTSNLKVTLEEIDPKLGTWTHDPNHPGSNTHWAWEPVNREKGITADYKYEGAKPSFDEATGEWDFKGPRPKLTCLELATGIEEVVFEYASKDRPPFIQKRDRLAVRVLGDAPLARPSPPPRTLQTPPSKAATPSTPEVLAQKTVASPQPPVLNSKPPVKSQGDANPPSLASVSTARAAPVITSSAPKDRETAENDYLQAREREARKRNFQQSTESGDFGAGDSPGRSSPGFDSGALERERRAMIDAQSPKFTEPAQPPSEKTTNRSELPARNLQDERSNDESAPPLGVPSALKLDDLKGLLDDALADLDFPTEEMPREITSSPPEPRENPDASKILNSAPPKEREALVPPPMKGPSELPPKELRASTSSENKAFDYQPEKDAEEKDRTRKITSEAPTESKDTKIAAETESSSLSALYNDAALPKKKNYAEQMTEILPEEEWKLTRTPRGAITDEAVEAAVRRATGPADGHSPLAALQNKTFIERVIEFIRTLIQKASS